MKILILGTGYLGSEIAFSLSKTHNITCIDHGNNSSKLNFKNRKIKFFQDDLKNENLIKKLSRDVDLICYCINTGGVVDCLENSDLYKKINIDDFKQLLELIDNKKCHFLLLSTAFVYSDSEMNSEDCAPNPETLYGKFRFEQETLLMKSNLPYTILRMSNIYGHQHFFDAKFNNVIDKFILNIFSNREISLYGDGKQLVDFVHIDDFLNLLDQIVSKKPKNEIYNISNESRISINDLAINMKNIAKNKYNLSVLLKKQSDTDKLPNIPYTSTSKIQKNFSWKNSDNMKLRLESIFEELKNS